MVATAVLPARGLAQRLAGPGRRAPDINDDARFICRSKVVDLDVAVSLFPSREDALTHDAYELGARSAPLTTTC